MYQQQIVNEDKRSNIPQVSVIVPIYKVEKYLTRCLDSILHQTFNDFEIICVNDGSPDSCSHILDEYAKKDWRIKVITQKNQGLSVARNTGLKHIKGKYVYFVDSDDAIHPQLLEFSLRLLEENHADLLCFNFEKSDGISYCPKKLNYNQLKYKIVDNPVFYGCKKGKYQISFNVWSKVYTKDLIKNLNFIPHIQFEDFPFTYAVLAKRPKTIIINEKLYFYTQRQTSISYEQDTPNRIRDYKKGIDFILKIYNVPKLKKEFNFLKRNFIPSILKQQYNRCLRANRDNQEAMFQEFSKELLDLKNQGLLSWRGHKLKRYLAYRKLMKKYMEKMK